MAISPPSTRGAPIMTSSAKKQASPATSISGSTWRTVEISEPRPMWAPRMRNQGLR